MTLGTTHSSLGYDGDGATTDFAVTFEFHATTDLELIVVTTATGTESLKSLGADYSVSGGGGATGSVSMMTAPTVAERLIIRRISSDQQPDDLRDGGALAAEPLERRLDIIAARLQELETDIARSLKVTKGSQATGLDLNLVGGKNRQLTVASDEQGVIIATGTLPDTVQTSEFGEEWVALNSELEARNRLMLGTAAVKNVGTSGTTIPLLNGNNSYSGTATFSADATFNSDLIVNAPLVLPSETLTIASGAVTPMKSSLYINNENAASADNLDNINVTNHPVGSVIKVKAKTSGQMPTLRHATGNIFLDENQNVALDDRDKSIWLERREAVDGEHDAGWYEIGRNFSAFKAGDVVQSAFATDATEYAVTTVIPEDTSVPESGEGTAITPLNTTITPRFSNSKIRVTFTGLLTVNNGRGCVALFKDSDVNAIAVGGFINDSAAHYDTRTFVWYLDATDTAARTYKVNFGPGGGTAYLNRSATANLYGSGTLVASLTVEEIAQ